VAGIVDQALDLLQGEAQLTPDQDLLQPGQVLVAVEPVTGLRAPARTEQADLVVVVQGPDGDAGQAGKLAYGSHGEHRRA
jgi:hypothetical protein